MARILIVNDDAAIRDGLSETVRDLGLEPVSAASGREALSRLMGHHGFDAVLLDLRMPGDIDRMEVLRRQSSVGGGPPVTVLTAFANAANTIEAMQLGAHDHLTKHVRGSFTGATADRLGAFREADGGTLFLDEIGDMPASMQAKILRVLQDRVVVPVGGRAMAVYIRLVAATHRDLSSAVAAAAQRPSLLRAV